MIDLDALDAAATAATAGPWRWECRAAGPADLVGRAGEPGVYDYDSAVLEASHYGECGCRSACALELIISETDQTYLAAASPDVLLELIARVRASESAVARVRALQPTWTQGMYGARDDVFSRTAIARALGDE